MSVIRIPILGVNTAPDDSGDVFIEPYSIKATNDVWKLPVFIFNDSGTRIGLRGSFHVPKDYVGVPKIVVPWAATATAGVVEWDFDYRAVADGESFDQAGTQESVNQSDTAPAAINEKQTALLILTAGNFAVDDTVLFELFRDGTDAGDTMAAAAILFGLQFEYTDV